MAIYEGTAALTGSVIQIALGSIRRLEVWPSQRKVNHTLLGNRVDEFWWQASNVFKAASPYTGFVHSGFNVYNATPDNHLTWYVMSGWAVVNGWLVRLTTPHLLTITREATEVGDWYVWLSVDAITPLWETKGGYAAGDVNIVVKKNDPSSDGLDFWLRLGRISYALVQSQYKGSTADRRPTLGKTITVYDWSGNQT